MRKLTRYSSDIDLKGEIWKPLLYKGVFSQGYYISDKSRVRSERFLLSVYVDERGYPQIFIGGRRIRCHVALLETFEGVSKDPRKTQVNHIDGNRFNAVRENLEWATPSENQKHAYKLGLNSQRHRRALTNEQVRELRAKYVKGCRKYGARAFANRFKVSVQVIYGCITGKTYQDVL